MKVVFERRRRILVRRLFSLKSRGVTRSTFVRLGLLIDSGPLIDVRAEELNPTFSDTSKSFESDDLREDTAVVVYNNPVIFHLSSKMLFTKVLLVDPSVELIALI